MALQTSGAISLNDVNVELGNSGTASINMNSSDVRGLFGVASGAISMSDGYGASSGNIYGNRALIQGGHSSASGGHQTDVEYFNQAASISAATFGSMLSAYSPGKAFATTNGPRALFSNGNDSAGGIGYFTVASTGNATSFGSLTVARATGAACTNIVRGVFISGSFGRTMDYVTIATTGNATSFGLFSDRGSFYMAATESSAGRGIIAGGFPNPGDAKILYITIATTGNTSTFGNLAVAKWNHCSGTNGTRAVWSSGQTASGGNSPDNHIQYNTIATTGNATTFGYQSTGNTYMMAGTSNGTYMHMSGGLTTVQINTVQRVTVATTGNASSVGVLTKTRQGPVGTSGT
jgi:hypothetical protein